MNDAGSKSGGRGFAAADQAMAEDLEKVALHDLAALNRLFNQTYGRLLRICMRITQDRESAEDVLQEVYIKIWNRAAGYDRTLSTPMAWLGRLARNSAIDWYRAQARRRANALSDEVELSGNDRAIDDNLIDQEQHNRAIALIDGDEQRDSIRDIYFEGLTYAELALRDGVPVGTVKSRIHRTLIRLSQKWQND